MPAVRLGRKRRVGAVLVMLAVLGLAPPASIAEDRSSLMRFWLDNPQPAVGVEPAARPRMRTRRSDSIARPVVEHRAPAFMVARKRIEPGYKIGVFGDVFAANLAHGLSDAYQSRQDVGVDNPASVSLAQADYAAWLSQLDARLGGAGKIDYAVVMLGSDDMRPIKTASGDVVAPGTAAWRQAYGDRVGQLASLFQRRRIPLTWVGLPIVRDADQSRGYADLNALYRDQVGKAGASFVDSWEAFVDDNGQYETVGPDVTGQPAKLRRADGVGLTRAGARKLASFIEPDVKRALEDGAAATQLASVPADDRKVFDEALQIDVNAQILREAGQGAAPAAVTARPSRLVVGPVVSLTEAPRSPGAQLATLNGPDATPDVLVAETLVQGRVPAFKPGRTDDFRWPRL